MTLTLADKGGFGFGIDAVANVFALSGKSVVSFGANSQQQVTLSETGTYVVQVQANNLVSSGQYNLGLVCDQAPTPNSQSLPLLTAVQPALGPVPSDDPTAPCH